ncbi:MAG: phosphate acyltransferase, partial [Actinomycetes bacterium]
MARALYVMALEPESGKSIVSLGLMEMLSRHVDRVGYFRPVVRAGDSPDVSIELMRSQYHLNQSYEESFGVTTAQTRHVVGSADAESIIADILGKFEEVSRRCEIVLVDGSDYLGASAAFEFEMNVAMAANLAAPVVVVSRAHDHRPDQISGALHAAHGSLLDHEVPVIGYVINRVDSSKLEDLKSEVADLGAPAWYLPEIPTMLLPTVGQVCDYLGAELLLGDQANLDRTVGAVRVAAMTVPNLLGRLVNDSLLIVPADRSDVIMAALASKYSMQAPRVAGLVLTGGFDPDPHVFNFVKGFAGPQTPVMQVQGDTYDTVAKLKDLRPEIEARDERKISLALGLFETHVDTTELAKLVQVTESTVVTPLMFENRLLRQARSAKQRVVLPEGDDDRVLTAADRLLQREVCDLTILGRPDRIQDRAKSLGLHLDGATLIDPNTSPLREEFTVQLYELRKH